VAQWLDARKNKDQAKLKTFLNTVLGETWEERGEAPPWKPLFNRRETYPIGVVPQGGLVLTAGADVQVDRIELEIVAWARGLESWSVEYLVLPGKTAEPEVWLELDKVLAREWRHAGGGRMPLLMLAIDSSFATSTVYAWAVHQSIRQVMVARGTPNLHVPVGLPLRSDVSLAGKMRSRGLRVWPVGVSMLKSQLYGWLRHDPPAGKPPPPGFLHFPEYGEEWFEQLTAESLVPRARKGHRFATTTEWVKTRERNEALDCRIYARAAAALARIDHYEEAHWTELERRLGLASPPPPPEDAERPPAPGTPPAPPEAGGQPRRGGRFDRWRTR
jgi:phage terminase large subunit GpA-like protein